MNKNSVRNYRTYYVFDCKSDVQAKDDMSVGSGWEILGFAMNQNRTDIINGLHVIKILRDGY